MPSRRSELWDGNQLKPTKEAYWTRLMPKKDGVTGISLRNTSLLLFCKLQHYDFFVLKISIRRISYWNCLVDFSSLKMTFRVILKHFLSLKNFNSVSKMFLSACPGYETYDGSYFSEDCLYMNIYKPSGAQNLPIFIWIHGGGFVDGQR